MTAYLDKEKERSELLQIQFSAVSGFHPAQPSRSKLR